MRYFSWCCHHNFFVKWFFLLFCCQTSMINNESQWFYVIFWNQDTFAACSTSFRRSRFCSCVSRDPTFTINSRTKARKIKKKRKESNENYHVYCTKPNEHCFLNPRGSLGFMTPLRKIHILHAGLLFMNYITSQLRIFFLRNQRYNDDVTYCWWHPDIRKPACQNLRNKLLVSKEILSFLSWLLKNIVLKFQ